MTEKLPQSRLIFSDTTTDGFLTLTVWYDPTLEQTDLMRKQGIEYMGIIRIYNNKGQVLAHEERIPLSRETLDGPAPSEMDMEYWDKLVNQFYADYD